MVDSNSAGDSFVGGFLAKIILILEQKKQEGIADDLIFTQDDLQQSINAGNIMALQVLQRYGCTFPEIDQIKQVIKDNQF